MEEDPSSTILDAEVTGIKFSLATRQEICTASISDSSISHASQLSNPFLGLPLEFGKCESCGTSEPGRCEGHFGYIELPVPIYHPSHIGELKRMLNLLCLSCLKMKTNKSASNGVTKSLLPSCCEDVNASRVSVREVQTTDGACYLALTVLRRKKKKVPPGFWSFLEKYGYQYESDNATRALLPCEVREIIKKLPSDTKKKLAGKGYFPQDGYILKYLPVPPNCLSVPEVSDGISVMSSDPSLTVLRKVLRKVEIIKNSRSGDPNFVSHQVEANDLQSLVDQYLQIRGTTKPVRDIETHYGVNKELNESSTKAWLEKMRTLFIRKGSGFSSRSVITGESYKRINEVGIPLEIAQRITFEERVNIHNMNYLQELVDKNLCLTYREGLSTYSLRESSKGHIYLKPGQVVHRRIMDGDIVFINRPPTTHKHSLQALSVYIHDDHTVKINPLICGPLGADFDGDCIHLFYPQSLAAKAEVLELFSLEKQLLSSHSGNLNLQLATDSLLSLKMLFKMYFLDKVAAHQLSMFLSPPLPQPALLKANSVGPFWTAVQMLQCALPSCFDCTGGQYMASQSEIIRFDFSREVLPTMINEIAASMFFGKGPGEVMKFFNVIQPFLMESLFVEGFSVSLKDFCISGAAIRNVKRSIGKTSPLLYQLRSIYNESVQQQLEKDIRDVKLPIINFILKSRLGDLIDSKSESTIDKVVQQIGFLGLQLSDRGKFYSNTLVEDMALHFHSKYHDGGDYPSAEYGLLKGCFIYGLDPYEEMVHSISTREILVRSSRGLSEPGTLFKNLMAILRDVVICYDGTVRNVCSNSIIQFEYGVKAGDMAQHLFPPGEPVGVLAATAMSNPAYKAVLDASPSSNSSWALMKEILLCKVSFKNEPTDRRVILYLNDCCCGRMYCRENAAYMVKNQLRKVILKDVAVEFTIEYKCQRTGNEISQTDAGLVGHIHLNEMILKEMRINIAEVVQRCQETLKSFHRKKKIGPIFKKIELFCSESSSPCVSFLWLDGDAIDLDRSVNILADIICPVLLETVIKGDPRISSASIIWINPETNMWVQSPGKSPKGELALDIVLEKTAVKQSGDAWRIVLDSCLPVLHLIDTTRSMPYAIKQVQELLGISCTFDQAIQRLASSVKMVAKGVLREHLILLASSMTCGGNLIGFNTGGYKSLVRQLNIQVPFTEATLFTPRKCFERAAEKCHTDTLSSIVASCSWGKCVSVGTGSRFDVLWDAKEVKPGGADVYSFLNMVRSATHEESNDACVGGDIDDFLGDENMDWGMSPEHNTEAVFEENCDLLNVSRSNGWDTDTHDDPAKTKSNDWSAWTQNNPEPQGIGSSISKGWGAAASWSRRADATDRIGVGENDSHYLLDSDGGKSDWDNAIKKKTESTSGWGEQPSQLQDDQSWGKTKSLENRDDQTWVKLKSQDNRDDQTWGKPKSQENRDDQSWGKTKSLESGDNQTWGKLKFQDNQEDQTWGKPKSQENRDDKSWGKPKSQEIQDDQPWGKSKFQENPDNQSWGNIKSQENLDDQSWGKPKSQQNQHDQSWGKPISQENQEEGTTISILGKSPSWGKPESQENQDDQSWEIPKSQEERSWAGSSHWDGKAIQKREEPASAWGKKVGDSWTESNQAVIQEESSQAVSSQGWDSHYSTSNSDGDRDQWKKQSRELFKKNRSEGSQVWGSNAGDRKNRNRPAKSPGMANHDTNISGLYTATRQRLDIFTSEEQDILKEVEPIMLSIRRIMQQSGYNDGDPLAVEDQTFVLENVFEHHPDKESKMGTGIDYFMVSKHSNFQDTRCLYIVSKDGEKRDFSYRKCLDNWIRKKYPELAEEFIGKYFKRPPPRPLKEPNSTPTND